MKTKEQIMDDYAVVEGYEGFNDLLNGFLEYKDNETMLQHIYNVLEDVQKELLNRVARDVIKSSKKESILNTPLL